MPVFLHMALNIPAGSSLIRELGLLNPLQQQRPQASQPRFGASLTQRPQAAQPAFNFDSILRQFTGLANQSIAPIASQINSQISDIQSRTGQERSRLESGREPLRQRYESLIADIKGQGQESENTQTRITSGELAKRGITNTSTLAQQEIQNAVQPIRRQTQTSTGQLGAQREQDLLGLEGLISQLLGQESQAVGGLRGNLANLQSSALSNAFTSALPFLQQSGSLARPQLASSPLATKYRI